MRVCKVGGGRGTLDMPQRPQIGSEFGGDQSDCRKLHSISSLFGSVRLVGRPYGGCSILYRKSLSTCITPLDSCSSRFCGIKIHDSSGLSLLLVSVYMPSEIGSSLNEYLSTLGELEGFIDSHPCDNTFLVGDFNVDFTRGGPLKDLLTDFVSELNLYMCA